MSATPEARARFFLRRGDHARALEAVAAGLADAPDDPDLRLIEVRALTGLGRHDPAVAAAARLVAAAPDAWWAHAAQADALGGAGCDRDACEAGGRAVAAGPEQPEAWIALAMAELGDERPREAQDAAEMALLWDPESVDAALVRAWALAARGRAADARAAFNEILARDPEHAHAHAGLAAADLTSLRFRDARDAARCSLAIAPDDPGLREVYLHTVRARTPLGRVLYTLGALVDRLPEDAGWWVAVLAWLGVQMSVRGPVRERIGDTAAAAIGISWVVLCVITWVGPWLIDRALRGDPETTHLYEHRKDDGVPGDPDAR